MHILLIDAHETCASLRTNVAFRQALVLTIAIEQQKEQTPMQTIHIHNLDRYPMVAEPMPAPKRPQGMNKPRRIDLHRANKYGRR